MSSEKNRSDALAMRAVAHPVRLDLLSLLDREGPLTASRCAEALGLTPKVCSYHLTQLGKYGLIEETGDGKGRARPWRLVVSSLDYVHGSDETEDLSTAADQYVRTMVGRDARIVESFVDHRAALPRKWRNVATMSSNPLRLSPTQLRALGSDLISTLDRYRKLSENPDPDAHPVQVALYAVPVELTDLTR
ncbi:winged helix-turn-helix domain-containing protein [Microlunatus parietis]|uniref:DNA-binding transcriptional ArsR family regulator n=1 Tax=Microlunatus parietis TaxID=682979 RepID=A0A7Y9I2Q4_9ACTN|nr:winged helix-turn-helix domain-containing protein [Microlunatus parietis]NYE69098.1 DNA-binding transcriptional ArsR family regulator [Microlunatus parietis]